MPKPIPEDRSENAFGDFKGEYTPEQAVIEANRCLFCNDAPCVIACPTSIDIPQFIRKIATGNVRGSAKTIFDANILGMSCARVCPVEVLCVGDCVYNEMGVPPIQIGKLQRYATDVAYQKGWRFFEAGADTGKSIGLVGGGPASIAAAHELRRFGHGCTIYEQRDVTGGLNTWGVAPYKMKADRSIDEATWVLEIGGIEVKTGVTVGKDVSWEELEKRHDALFIGVGIGPDSMLGIPGEELEGVHGALDFIEQMKLGKVSLDDVSRAVIVGGGNTAIDGVREAIGLGVPTVSMLYRRSEAKMSGYAHEWSAAKTEGAHGSWYAQPLAFEGNGKVERVRCAKLDESCRPIDDEQVVVPADLVLIAIGQAKVGNLFDGLDGIDTDGGRVAIDDDGFTGRPGYYAGGDCANGGKEVVNAAAQGKAAARAIHKYVTGGDRA